MPKKERLKKVREVEGIDTSTRVEMFCQLYVLYNNASRAAREAGYSVNTKTDHIFSRKGVVERIQELRAAQFRRLEMTELEVLGRLGALARFDARQFFKDDGSHVLPHELPPEAAIAVRGLETELKFDEDGSPPTAVRKYKFADPLPALRLIAQIKGMVAPDGANVNIFTNLDDRMDAARKRIREQDKVVSEQ